MRKRKKHNALRRWLRRMVGPQSTFVRWDVLHPPTPVMRQWGQGRRFKYVNDRNMFYRRCYPRYQDFLARLQAGQYDGVY